MIQILQTHLQNINPTAPILVTQKSIVPLTDILDIKAFDVTDTTRAVLPSASIPITSQQSSHSDSHTHCHDQNCSHTHAHTHTDTHMDSEQHVPFTSSVNDPHDTAIHSFVLENTSARAYINLEKLKKWLAIILWNEPEDGINANSTTVTVDVPAVHHSSSSTSTSSDFSSTTSVSSSTSAYDIFRMKGILNVKDSDKPTYLQAVQQMYDLQPGTIWPIKYQSGQPFTRIFMIGRVLHEEKLQKAFEQLFEA